MNSLPILSFIFYCVFLQSINQYFLSGGVSAEIFTSTEGMKKMLTEDNFKLSSHIEKYIQMEMDRLERVRQAATNYENHVRHWLKNNADSSLVVSNPVAAFMVIKRLVDNWTEVEKVLSENTSEIFLKSVNLIIPTDDDFLGASMALMRLQDTYEIETQQLANGEVPGVAPYGPMTASDCYSIAYTAYDTDDFYHAILWFREAISRYEIDPNNESNIDTYVQLMDAYAYSLYQQDNFLHAYLVTKRVFKYRPDHNEALKSLEMYKELVEKNSTVGKNISDYELEDESGWPPIVNNRTDDFVQYESLCRGEGVKVYEDPDLYCYYKTDNPFLRLARVKVEILSLDPVLYVFHDVVNDEEIDFIKNLAAPDLHRSEVVHENGTGIAEFRISQSMFLVDEYHPILERLTQRISDMTGLSMETSEYMQVANYGLGGFYEWHHDSTGYYTLNKSAETGDDDDDEETAAYHEETEEDARDGDRIATFMIYLSQPSSGGATVFTNLDIGLFPTKGDALFWYGLHKNGTADVDTVHAACPVLSGEKWVLNKWIREHGQLFLRPCSLDENE